MATDPMGHGRGDIDTLGQLRGAQLFGKKIDMRNKRSVTPQELKVTGNLLSRAFSRISRMACLSGRILQQWVYQKVHLERIAIV